MEVTKLLQGVPGIESVDLEHIKLCCAALKELSAQWVVEMADYTLDNPQVVNGFRRVGISRVLNGYGVTEDMGVSDDNSSDTSSDEVGGSFSGDSDDQFC